MLHVCQGDRRCQQFHHISHAKLRLFTPTIPCRTTFFFMCFFFSLSLLFSYLHRRFIFSFSFRVFRFLSVLFISPGLIPRSGWDSFSIPIFCFHKKNKNSRSLHLEARYKKYFSSCKVCSLSIDLCVQQTGLNNPPRARLLANGWD